MPATLDAKATQTARTTIADAMARTNMAAAHTGRGVTIALVDTGVAPSSALEGADIVVGPDFSSEPWFEGRDTNGHGTHLAGIVTAMAPDARLLSLRAGETAGQTHPSAVANAIDWLVHDAPSQGLGAQVLVLAYSIDRGMPEAVLVEDAVRRAHAAGITVVVASGNTGEAGLPSPAHLPEVITVGAEAGTDGFELGDFSTRGDRRAPVDVLAPGRSIVSARAIGARADQDNQAGRVGETLVAATGTSQSAAVVGAAAARVIQATGLHNDGVKAALTSTARAVADSEAGIIDVSKAAATVDLDAVIAQIHTQATGAFTTRWTGATWTGATWTGTRWMGATWTGATWTGTRWMGATWTGATWTGTRWMGATWTGATWTGTRWMGATWTGATWTGTRWMGATWTGATWTGTRWMGATWTGATWTGTRWMGATWTGATWTGTRWMGATWTGATWT